MSTRSTRKRPRRDSDAQSADPSPEGDTRPVNSDDNSPSARTRDEEFWFEDGNVILVARDVEFRVFKGVLARYSPVFRDMFSLPQPGEHASSARNSGDCPVVTLQDNPEDVRELLRVCMPPSGTSPFFPDHPSYDTISATIRLGHKYQISDMVQHGVGYLKTYFTDTLDSWLLSASADHMPPEFDRMHPIGVVNLARLTGELSMLPTALLLCCQLDSDIVQGFDCENGSREHLGLDDIGRCFAAHATLLRESVRIALCVFRPEVARNCKAEPSCRLALQAMVKGLEKRSERVTSDDVFHPFANLHNLSPLCKRCQELVRARDMEERWSLWTRLPAIFDIPVPGWGGEADVEVSSGDGA